MSTTARLTPTQRTTLGRMAASPAGLDMAPGGYPGAGRDASRWWRTMEILQAAGLVERLPGAGGTKRITPAGRAAIGLLAAPVAPSQPPQVSNTERVRDVARSLATLARSPAAPECRGGDEYHFTIGRENAATVVDNGAAAPVFVRFTLNVDVETAREIIRTLTRS